MKQLLFSVTKKDLDISWFSGTGNGGGNRNAHRKCCRILHRESGSVGVGQDERSAEQNLRNAFKRMATTKTFKTWLRIKTSEALVDKEQELKQIEAQVNNAMQEKNLQVEFYTPEE